MFTLSPDATVRMLRFGAGERPVIVVDAAAAGAEALVSDAAARRFTRIGPYYPGVRAELNASFVEGFIAAIAPLVTEAFGVDGRRASGQCFYSLVTTPGEALAPIQRFPHYDGVEEGRIAVVHFLCVDDFGGTAFYRHRATGFEYVDAERFPAFKAALEEDVRAHGLPPARYIDDGAPFFERTGLVSSQFNRMLIYGGNRLHCSAIPPGAALSADPRRGRLTLNAFLTIST